MTVRIIATGEILTIWRGGMSFHGGFLGVVLAMTWSHLA